MKRADFLRRAIAAQRAWIEEHGGSLAAYVERYGSADDAAKFGNGGEAIYAADAAELVRLEGALARFERRAS